MIANDADHNERNNPMTKNKTNEVTAADEAEVLLDELDADATETDEPEAEVTYSAKALADEIGADPKSFRRWFRSNYTDRAGKGRKYAFTAETKDAVLAAYLAKDEAAEADADDEVNAEG